jgi:hypothetical protein
MPQRWSRAERSSLVIWAIVTLTTVQFVQYLWFRSDQFSFAFLVNTLPLLVYVLPLSVILCAPLLVLRGRRGSSDSVWLLAVALLVCFSVYLFGFFVPDGMQNSTSVGAAMGMMVLILGFGSGSVVLVSIADWLSRRRDVSKE